MKTILCIPTYNERDNIGKLISAIIGVMDLHHLDGIVLVIDDNSPDGTAEIVLEWAKKDDRVVLLSRSKKTGLGSAYRAGFHKALELQAEVIFEMDADFSHDPQMIPIMLRALEDADLIVGSRKVGTGRVYGWGVKRRMVSWGANALTHLLLGLKTHDVTSGFRAIRADVIKKIDLDKMKTEGYAFQLEFLYLVERVVGGTVLEVPISFADRVKGHSKLGISDILEFGVQVLRLFLRRPMKKSYI